MPHAAAPIVAGPWSALDDLLDPVVVVRPVSSPERGQLCVVYANRPAVAWGTVIGGTWPGCCLGEVSEAALAYSEDVWRTGQPTAADALAIHRRDGSECFIDLRLVSLGAELLITWRDVTRQVKGERALAASEARYRAIIDALPDASAILVPVLDERGQPVDFIFAEVNDAAVAWGTPQGSSLRERTELTQAWWLFDMYFNLFASGEPMVIDDCLLSLIGAAPRYLDIRAILVGGEIFASWRDVTRRHDVEQALADSETRFRMAFDQAPVGIIIISLGQDDLGRVLSVNPALAEMLDFTVPELVGRPSSELLHPDDATNHAALLEEFAHGQSEGYRLEHRMRCADDTWLWARTAMAVVRENGTPVYLIGHVEDVSARRAAESELARKALYDSLTGLPNWSLMMDHLSLAVGSLSRPGAMLAVLYLDLNKFKDINEMFGHLAGDEVIREVAHRLSTSVTPPDSVARLNADEFVAIVRVTGDVGGARLAEMLYRTVSQPMPVAGNSLVIRPSIGVTVTTKPDAQPAQLLREADLAMQQAKSRHQSWALYDDTLQKEAMGRFAIQERLRLAMNDGQLRLLYQPIVDLDTGRIVSAEALLRLADADGSLLTPDMFIDVAEESDLIVPIGGWVLSEACRQLARWQKVRPDMQVSVNVSARQVAHHVIREQAHAATIEHRVQPSTVQLEITERLLLDADASAMAELVELDADGYRFAIDDFGTGFASLTYLKRFPVSVVKIDRSFVDGLGRREDDSAIVEAVASLARTLRLTAVAEGVETQEQLDVLRRFGCHRGQGYLFGRPAPAETLDEMVRG